jgi:hypothetical protein
MFDTEDLIRTWEADGFKLELYDTYQAHHGKAVLAFRFSDGGQLVFQGEEYGCSPLHAIDGDESVAGLLAFLSLRPGDTDREYFANYTPEQIAWVQSGRAETLACLQSELEEHCRHRREYEGQVKGPGKFEGEARYVPYFWGQFLAGAYTDDDGEVVSFDVSDEDRRLFPELEGVTTVSLAESENGFVYEC